MNLTLADFERPCDNCQHFAGSVCLAFPSGIPAEVLAGRNQHRTPIDGDSGIQFKSYSNDIDYRELREFEERRQRQLAASREIGHIWAEPEPKPEPKRDKNNIRILD